MYGYVTKKTVDLKIHLPDLRVLRMLFIKHIIIGQISDLVKLNSKAARDV